MNVGLPPGRQTTCRWCGLLVILDDVRLIAHHEAPICTEFEAACESLGGKKRLTAVLVPEEKKPS